MEARNKKIMLGDMPGLEVPVLIWSPEFHESFSCSKPISFSMPGRRNKKILRG
jgi:hypothetical protein